MILSRLIIILPSVEYVHIACQEIWHKSAGGFLALRNWRVKCLLFLEPVLHSIFRCFQNKDFRDVSLQKMISLRLDLLWKCVTAWRVVTTFCGRVIFWNVSFVANFLIGKKRTNKQNYADNVCFTIIWLCKFVKNYKLAYWVLVIGFKLRASCDCLFIPVAECTSISHLCPEGWWMLHPWKQSSEYPDGAVGVPARCRGRRLGDI